MCENIRCSKATTTKINRKMKKFNFLFYLVPIFYSLNNYAQLQSENILFSINEKENFIIDEYFLYTDKGKFSIEDEVYKQNWYNYFLKYNGKIIGRYTIEDETGLNKLTCELYITNKRISNLLGIKKSVFLINSKKNEFEKNIENSVNNLSSEIINSGEILNNKGYFLYKYKYYNASLIYLIAVIQKYPSRVVAYLNIADNYWELHEKEKAIENYKKYIKLMEDQKKDLKRIPKYVYERLKKC